MSAGLTAGAGGTSGTACTPARKRAAHFNTVVRRRRGRDDGGQLNCGRAAPLSAPLIYRAYKYSAANYQVKIEALNI